MSALLSERFYYYELKERLHGIGNMIVEEVLYSKECIAMLIIGGER